MENESPEHAIPLPVLVSLHSVFMPYCYSYSFSLFPAPNLYDVQYTLGPFLEDEHEPF